MNNLRPTIVEYYLTPVVETSIGSITSYIKISFKLINVSTSCTIFTNDIASQFLALKKINAIIELIDLDLVNKIKTSFTELPVVSIPIYVRQLEYGPDIEYLTIDFMQQLITFNGNTINSTLGSKAYTIILVWLKSVLEQTLVEKVVRQESKHDLAKLETLDSLDKEASKTFVLEENDYETIYPYMYQLWLK
jgi:hypothetical protein